MIHATLCFIVREGAPSHILLGRKKRGFGMGKLNGIGGKLDPDESPEAGIIREVHEEVGLTLSEKALHSVGQITFQFPFKPKFEHFVHLFLATEWEGEPIETAEMAPYWFPVSAIPYEQMWQDDAYWLPIVLNGNSIVAEFEFGEDNETVVSWVVRGGTAISSRGPETRIRPRETG